jgi:hypothetical protein
MYRSTKTVKFSHEQISSLLTYFEFIKKPAKTKRGIIIGTTNAAAASGDGALNPITDPS